MCDGVLRWVVNCRLGAARHVASTEAEWGRISRGDGPRG